MTQTRNGIDNLKSYGQLLQGKRLGLITNQTAVSLEMESVIDILAVKFNLVALFALEHGIRGVSQNGVQIADEQDKKTGLPVYSLYGKNRHFLPEWMDKIDAVVFDLQDIGGRPFSYLPALADIMEDCIKFDRALIILDRINPLGGALEGVLPDPEFDRSWGYGVPLRFGLTIGEYARWINGRYFHNDCRLDVAPCSGWDRSKFASDCNLQWINPAPNIPCENAALIYAGGCMFGQTNVSEARGTTRPYEMFGAPYIDGGRLADDMNRLALPGVIFRECAFIAQYNAFNKYIGKPCFGVQLHIMDRRKFNSFATGMRLIEQIRRDYPEFAIPFANGKCEAAMFDSVVGTSSWREGKESADELIKRAEKDCEKFKKEVRPFLIYDDFAD